MAHTPTIVDGVLFPSVTEVLSHPPKPWLEKWRAKWGKRADQKTAAANNIGTQFHKCVEDLINNGILVCTNDRASSMIKTFHRWASTVHIEIIATELKVISHKHRYAGTFDAVGVWKNRLYVFDWKTSSGIYPDMQLQLVAYAKAYEEQTGQKVTHGAIVHVSKDKPHHKLTVAEYEMTPALFRAFLKRLKAYRKAVNA